MEMIQEANAAKPAMIAQAIADITAGVLVAVVDASGHFNAVCIGDFRDNGWAEKCTTRDSMYWRWTGPNAIELNGAIVEPNSYTEEIDMDWT
jgi:hypothetical protein